MKPYPLYAMLALGLGAAPMLMLPSPAQAQTARQVRDTAQASMVLTGTIDIAVDGSVENLLIEQEKTITPTIFSYVDATVRDWRFKPIQVDGRTVAARAPIRLRLQTRPLPDGSAEVAITDADFSSSGESTEVVTRSKLVMPSYPDEAYWMGGRGTVLLLLKIDRKGEVAEAVVEQVNLTVAGTQPEMVKLRRLFGNSALSAARRWKFTPPTTGPDKDAAWWSVRVPVAYIGTDKPGNDVLGKWNAYIPGPKQTAPWRTSSTKSSDLLPAGGVYMADSSRNGPELLTPLAEG